MTQSNNVWIVDDDESIRWVLEKAMQKAGLVPRSFQDGQSALTALDIDSPDVLITDIRMPGLDGLALLERINQRTPDLPVIVITAHSDLDAAVSAYQTGAFEYLPKPFDLNDAVELTKRAIQSRVKTTSSEQEADEDSAVILGESPAMQEVFRIIGRLSQSRINVLINGESGTGKELVAHALHLHSPRAKQPFIAINTAAIPRDLLESELFGHEKGAFTGAHSQRKGRFEQADAGTLFLDEIGDMPSELQTRLLRVLADGVFYRVGGRDPVKVDVRIIAATHQNLETLVRQGMFREDLFHRLNVIRIKLPALRERREDIPLLVKRFLKQSAEEIGEAPKSIQPEVLHHLATLDWPGNVRQLENTCRWLTVMAAGREIVLSDLPPELQPQPDTATVNRESSNDWQQSLSVWASSELKRGQKQLLKDSLPQFETIMIKAALAHTRGYKQEAAKLLGWGRNTLTRKIKELGLKEFE